MLDEFGNEIPAPAGERVGFCQDCGKPLTQETVRAVGSGVFCEPCLEARVSAAGQAASSSYGAPAAGPVAGAGYPPPPPVSHSPSPVLAGFLGLIPGVGAMYNGQFAKGIVHLVIFAVLVMLSDNVSGVFHLFVFGWVCYQAFEAYHTAKARLEGLPLPNAFGFNDIGERMGFGKNWPGSVTRPNPAPPVTPWTPAPVPPVPPSNWAGYVPPAAFASAQTAVPPADPVAPPAQSASWSSPPYSAPSTAPYTPVSTGATTPAAAVPLVPSRKFPVGALWLIGLGLLFLLSINAHIRFSGLWLSAAILAGLSVWMFVQRIVQLHRAHPVGIPTGALLACVLRWPPVVLMVLAVLFALQAANLYTLGQTWPVIIIALGAVVLVERTVGRTPFLVAEERPQAPAWTPEDRKDDGTQGGAQ